MGEINCVVITKKDQKKLEELKRFLPVLGIDLNEISLLKKENESLKAKIDELEMKLSSLEDDMNKKIEEKYSRLEENVNKRAEQNSAELQKQMKTYLFTGSKIDEAV